MNAPAQRIEQLQVSLPDLDWVTDTGRVARLSQDFSWFSPVLKAQLEGKVAEAAVRPRTKDEIRRLVAECARLRVPITLRGTGTGNYGQAVPLHGGVVLDMSGYNGFLWARDGAARAQAGMRQADFEKHTREACGMEMRCMPSTFRSATLGGLYGGGFGGIGSINYGPLAARGNVLGLEAITIEEEPRTVELRGPDALALHHLWGTNGIVLELELALAPAVPWTECIATFPDFRSALACGDAIAQGPGITKREVAFFSADVCGYLKPLAQALPPGEHALLLAVAPASEAAVQQLVSLHGGRITLRQDADEVARTRRTLLEYTWNHTTLVALKSGDPLTYLQCAFTAGQHIEQVCRMDELLGAEVLMHTEFIRTMDGPVTCTSLPLVRYTGPQRLQQVMQAFRDNGVRINDPHVCIVEDGRANGELAPAAIAAKKQLDPLGLLNPGKVRAWMQGVPA